jgi:hypothetical protein
MLQRWEVTTEGVHRGHLPLEVCNATLSSALSSASQQHRSKGPRACKVLRILNGRLPAVCADAKADDAVRKPHRVHAAMAQGRRFLGGLGRKLTPASISSPEGDVDEAERACFGQLDTTGSDAMHEDPFRGKGQLHALFAQGQRQELSEHEARGYLGGGARGCEGVEAADGGTGALRQPAHLLGTPLRRLLCVWPHDRMPTRNAFASQ